MKRKKKPPSNPELPLFDLPLRPGAEPETVGDADLAGGPAAEAPAGERSAAAGAGQTSLFRSEDEGPEDDASVEDERPEIFAGWTERLQAGLADLMVQVLMLVVAATAANRLGADLSWSYWPPFAGLALIFSFLYWMVPVAFWGQTPGMAWIGLAARSVDDGPLTFYQTFLRWVGALLTAGLAGLPLLLSLGRGGSLSDRLSSSKTVVV